MFVGALAYDYSSSAAYLRRSIEITWGARLRIFWRVWRNLPGLTLQHFVIALVSNLQS